MTAVGNGLSEHKDCGRLFFLQKDPAIIHYLYQSSSSSFLFFFLRKYKNIDSGCPVSLLCFLYLSLKVSLLQKF